MGLHIGDGATFEGPDGERHKIDFGKIISMPPTEDVGVYGGDSECPCPPGPTEVTVTILPPPPWPPPPSDN